MGNLWFVNYTKWNRKNYLDSQVAIEWKVSSLILSTGWCLYGLIEEIMEMRRTDLIYTIWIRRGWKWLVRCLGVKGISLLCGWPVTHVMSAWEVILMKYWYYEVIHQDRSTTVGLVGEQTQIHDSSNDTRHIARLD